MRVELFRAGTVEQLCVFDIPGIPQASLDERCFDKIAAENALLIVPPLDVASSCPVVATPHGRCCPRCYFEETSTFSG